MPPLPKDLSRRTLLIGGAAGLWPLRAAAQTSQAAAPFWAALALPNAVVLMRHARTEPGVGDPPEFRLGVCSTQRNLSEAGRAQSQRIGQAFASAGVQAGEVRSSAWCRCVDTAQLAFGAHKVWAPLNSFFQGQGDRERQVQAVLADLATWRGQRPLVLVTHQVNITALTGEYLSMGEMFAVRMAPGQSSGLRVMARLALN